METNDDDNDRKFTSLSTRKLLNSGFQFMYGLNDIYDGAIQSCIEKDSLLKRRQNGTV
ncbi:NAD(P)-binding domain containing protein [Senna tora]|uniref:NAD(P)-binding domain containing protein n=1 Tax=Senna tora TaxID=362788 RepID=A0A835CLQ7_9FABA|nr:NAD(P)-binding domain containing protein [Senna tora]